MQNLIKRILVKVIESYKDLTKEFSENEKELFFYKNSESIYKI